MILAGVKGDLETIRFRQGVVKDCLDHPAVVRELYAIAVDANEKRKGSHFGLLARYPDAVLRDAIGTMETLLEFLKKLRAAAVESHVKELHFRNGELISAELGKANKGHRYLLHRMPIRTWTIRNWWVGLFSQKPPVYRFELAPRDEAGAQALQGLRNRGIRLAANALGQAGDHVRDFFSMLRAELAFCVGCINLHEFVVQKGAPFAMPVPAPAGEPLSSFQGLYDIGLALTVDRRVTDNGTNADRKNLVIITGPNSGGKTTYLRSVGTAQLMMQCGMFVPAESYRGGLCDGLFTHFKKEEDAAMQSGKFDEELNRMSEIVDHIAKHPMILFNESFASTNEREGSEIARQITTALLEMGVRILCVTHIYELAHGFYQRNDGGVLFLRAGRQGDGARTFKVIEQEPLPTSFGEDLYNSIFRAAPATVGDMRGSAAVPGHHSS